VDLELDGKVAAARSVRDQRHLRALGLTRTENMPAVLARQAQAAGVTPATIEERRAARTLVGRLIDADDVAAVVAFLASPKSVAINGHAIAAGGGTPGVIFY
jgi:NAD(P)-dependent dehydrogenase (short-subunit alcohol dehydrogenase family)